MILYAMCSTRQTTLQDISSSFPSPHPPPRIRRPMQARKTQHRHYFKSMMEANYSLQITQVSPSSSLLALPSTSFPVHSGQQASCGEVSRTSNGCPTKQWCQQHNKSCVDVVAETGFHLLLVTTDIVVLSSLSSLFLCAL